MHGIRPAFSFGSANPQSLARRRPRQPLQADIEHRAYQFFSATVDCNRPASVAIGSQKFAESHSIASRRNAHIAERVIAFVDYFSAGKLHAVLPSRLPDHGHFI